MLSRTADSLFWLSRYMERTDGLLRATSSHYILSLDSMVMGNMTWRSVLEVFTTLPNDEIATLEHNSFATLHALLTDVNSQSSLKVIVTRARENARGAQDHITKEVWEEVNALYHLLNQSNISDRQGEQDVIKMMLLFTQHSLLYTGVADVTMPRGLGWSFMNLGKFIERCLEILVLVDKHYEAINYNLNEENVIIQWKELLFSLSGYELHLKTYRGSRYNRNVLHQVLFNEDFPHSVLYSLSRIQKYLEDVVTEHHSPGSAELTRRFGALWSKVKYTDPTDIKSDNLKPFLESTKQDLLQFSTRLGQNFFSYQ
ncbi:MAG: alpha-E domain-containing protein [Chitinophagaceae bacterium]|nr:alpha-E domain-containing protein [Chitinophagaceae bacterium]MCW5928576.1 alpha-E domain-containing protein [Chitinophagaceae bacterium]